MRQLCREVRYLVFTPFMACIIPFNGHNSVHNPTLTARLVVEVEDECDIALECCRVDGEKVCCIERTDEIKCYYGEVRFD